jgi:hypothetical protein
MAGNLRGHHPLRRQSRRPARGHRRSVRLTRPPAVVHPAGPAPILPSTVRPGTGPP